MNIYLTLCLLVGGLFVCSSFAQKTDTIYLRNRDRITGELKKYEYGYLFHKTDGMGTLKVKYDRLSTFYSDKRFHIRMDDRFIYLGTFDTSGTEGYVKIIVTNDSILTKIESIVEAYPIKRIFWNKLSGNFDVGFNYAKSTEITQFNLSGNVYYKAEHFLTELKGSSDNTFQMDQQAKRSNEINYNFNRLMGKNWSAIGLAGVNQNDEMGIDLRVQAGMGIANHLIYTNLHRLMVVGGLMINNEWTSDTVSSSNYEGLAYISYDIFKFSNPDVNVSSYITAFPSLSVKNRIRTEFEVQGKIEIISDMYFSLKVYGKFDNKPPNMNSSSSDYGIVTSIGYSFN
ncbi:MAG: DUF481 domain-containing protein [Bacteroidales bacterium]|nr:DUF481 domain-containing protein [Bacteroidales bacterium]